MGRVAGTLEAEPEHLVTDREFADPVSDFDDDAGQIAAFTGRERGRESLVQRTAADAHLTGVDPGGADLEEYLAGAGYRLFDIGYVQHVAIAVMIETNRLDCRHLGPAYPDYARLQPFWSAGYGAAILRSQL